MLIGATDTGKTTFCVAAANACIARGQQCAIVDGDTGQSEIGPPASIGCAVADKPFSNLSELKPAGMFFTGSTSPPGHLLQVVTGLERMKEVAEVSNSPMIIIDMPGYVTGSPARTMIESAIAILSPDYVIMLARGSELAPLQAVLKGMRRPVVIPAPASPEAQRRSPEVRASRRRLKFAAYFSGASSFVVNALECGISRLGIFSGQPLKSNQVAFVERLLGQDLIHGERCGPVILLVTSKPADTHAEHRIAAGLQNKEVCLLSEQWFHNILVGLVDERGRHLAEGILERVDFRSQTLHILAPIRQPSVVRQVILGSIKVRPDGLEMGRVAQAALQLFPRARHGK